MSLILTKLFFTILKGHKKKSVSNLDTDFYLFLTVDPQGLEPWMQVPKTWVLPLHHGSLFYCECKSKTVL